MSVPARVIVVLAPLTLVSAGPTQADVQPWLVETGILELTKTVTNPAMTIETEETVYFRDWGRTVARFTTTKSSNQYVPGEQVERSWSLMEGEWITTVDLDDNTGTRMKNPMAGTFEGMSEADTKNFADSMQDALDTEIETVRQEELLGKKCDVTEAVTDLGGMKQITRTWTWKNIPFKTESEGMGSKILEEVKSAKFDVEVDGDKFEPPTGAKIQEVSMPGY